ncbi:MAG: two component transcriptional regulator, LuxR family [Xanthobacteraceae bacterium]|nr:two component transcriptional regulator, LuxR family [Xanthobacteraceae bacterium]
MASSEPIQSRHVSIVLMDDLPLRRASIHSLLRDWAQDEGISLEITEAEGHTVLGKIDPVPHLLVYNAGHSGATSSEWRTRVDELRRSFPEVPLVVISEDDSAPEVIEALRAGVRGFISARTPPAIVFQTLYFILAGGVYFPPSALLQAQALNTTCGRSCASSVPRTARRLPCAASTWSRRAPSLRRPATPARFPRSMRASGRRSRFPPRRGGNWKRRERPAAWQPDSCRDRGSAIPDRFTGAYRFRMSFLPHPARKTL